MEQAIIDVKNGDLLIYTFNGFKLHSVKIGNKIIYDVECSISNSLDAPMLLGQSVLKKFGKYTIDYTSNKLIIQ